MITIYLQLYFQRHDYSIQHPETYPYSYRKRQINWSAARRFRTGGYLSCTCSKDEAGSPFYHRRTDPRGVRQREVTHCDRTIHYACQPTVNPITSPYL